MLTIRGMAGLFSVLRHRDFRLLWLAGLASVLGDRIVTVALALPMILFAALIELELWPRAIETLSPVVG